MLIQIQTQGHLSNPFGPTSPDSSNTYEGVAPGVGPLLGRVDLLEPLAAGDAGRGAHVVDLEGLEADLLLLQLRRDLGVVVLRDQVGDDVEHLEGQVSQVLEHHGALEGGAEKGTKEQSKKCLLLAVSYKT